MAITAVKDRSMQRACARILLRTGLPITATFLLLNQASNAFQRPPPALPNIRNGSSAAVQCEQRLSGSASKLYDATRHPPQLRTRKTTADEYFREHKSLPLPSVMHAILPAELVEDGSRKGILVIGDVHGCYDELLRLHDKAVDENGGTPFQYVILVGDLCNKGPKSPEVIRHVRTTENWMSVRGNNDDGALAAALGHVRRRKRKNYQWVKEAEEESIVDRIALSDEDVIWMAELPYTIRIPGSLLHEDMDTVIVHAGLVPGVQLEDQRIETMIAVREVEKVSDGNSDNYRYEYRTRGKRALDNERYPWASLWKGPYRVVFGHDARRGLQLHEGGWAIGLDTGAVYGKKLTGMILPGKKLVQVESLEVYERPGGG